MSYYFVALTVALIALNTYLYLKSFMKSNLVSSIDVHEEYSSYLMSNNEKLYNQLKMLDCLSHLEIYLSDNKLRTNQPFELDSFKTIKYETQKSILETVVKLK
ncbi:hypothetical protein [Neotamlana laminarinivorans]|uniref:Uncharacterized protein n=1 Tax=Neotamlana laminarinivorans TaxID=2883124 RepID=A0A9X1I3E7_9FLAO|nr:hypothetical protein [Tamlana laminarinivorans]MCB4799938.1 hypothetical protein [Tamlana laminarinivorans]